MNLKKRLIRALKGPFKWQLEDGTIIEDTVKDFARRPVYSPYIPFYCTPGYEHQKESAEGPEPRLSLSELERPENLDKLEGYLGLLSKDRSAGGAEPP